MAGINLRKGALSKATESLKSKESKAAPKSSSKPTVKTSSRTSTKSKLKDKPSKLLGDFGEVEQREKCGWYLPVDLVDEIRNAVLGLKRKGLKVNAGRLVEPALRALLAELHEKYNDGTPFPEAPETKLAKQKRKRR